MRSAVRADTPGRGLTLVDPASASDRLEAGGKGVLCGPGSRLGGRVHTAEVLREEVFAVEVVGGELRRLVPVFGLAVGRRGRGWTRDARADVAAVDARTEVLRRDVAFPFVLGAEAGGAAVLAEGADKRAGVGREDVFLKAGYRGEGGLAVCADRVVRVWGLRGVRRGG